MPRYDYTCESGHQVTIERSIHAAEGNPTCSVEACESALKRVWQATPTIFNARGFYKNP
jgi:predicted nucleic acid-binding Zn ribbon protein